MPTNPAWRTLWQSSQSSPVQSFLTLPTHPQTRLLRAVFTLLLLRCLSDCPRKPSSWWAKGTIPLDRPQSSIQPAAAQYASHPISSHPIQPIPPFSPAPTQIPVLKSNQKRWENHGHKHAEKRKRNRKRNKKKKNRKKRRETNGRKIYCVQPGITVHVVHRFSWYVLQSMIRSIGLVYSGFAILCLSIHTPDKLSYCSFGGYQSGPVWWLMLCCHRLSFCVRAITLHPAHPAQPSPIQFNPTPPNPPHASRPAQEKHKQGT